MKTAVFLTVTLLAATLTARADLSYTNTRKTTGGQMASVAGGANQSSKFYLKGQKMKIESGESATILDFDAQTITTINDNLKSVTIRTFSELNPASHGVAAKISVRETGEKRMFNGYSAGELVMTMDIDSAQMGKMQLEMDMWLSADAPGAKEMYTFYEKNANRFPWAAMVAADNPRMQAAMAEVQRSIAEMKGVNVMLVMKLKAPGGNSLIEITMDSTHFSTDSIPDSVFAIPADYKKID